MFCCGTLVIPLCLVHNTPVTPRTAAACRCRPTLHVTLYPISSGAAGAGSPGCCVSYKVPGIRLYHLPSQDMAWHPQHPCEHHHHHMEPHLPRSTHAFICPAHVLVQDMAGLHHYPL